MRYQNDLIARTHLILSPNSVTSSLSSCPPLAQYPKFTSSPTTSPPPPPIPTSNQIAFLIPYAIQNIPNIKTNSPARAYTLGWGWWNLGSACKALMASLVSRVRGLSNSGWGLWGVEEGERGLLWVEKRGEEPFSSMSSTSSERSVNDGL